jgi:hypothetical protein
MAEIPKDGDYFVFSYYDTHSIPSELIVPFVLTEGKLKESEDFGSYDPQEHRGSKKCLNFLRERNIQKVFTTTTRGHYMYSELHGLIIHFSGGEGKYAFHYDPVRQGELEGIKIIEVAPEILSDDERENRRKTLADILCN